MEVEKSDPVEKKTNGGGLQNSELVKQGDHLIPRREGIAT
jgi:hypothetical protein